MKFVLAVALLCLAGCNAYVDSDMGGKTAFRAKDTEGHDWSISCYVRQVKPLTVCSAERLLDAP